MKLIGVEAGGRGHSLGEHAARFDGGGPGVLQGTYSYVLQDQGGQIAATHSVSAGLDYPAIGPEHAWLHDQGRAEYVSASDQEALDACRTLARMEGIIPGAGVGARDRRVHEARAEDGEVRHRDREHFRPRRQGHRDFAGESGAMKLVM